MKIVVIAVIWFSTFYCTSTASAQGKCGLVYSTYRNSVVSLTIDVQNENTGVIGTSHGTGFIITPDGFVFTAAHLLPRMDGFKIRSIKGTIGDLYSTPFDLDYIDSNQNDIAIYRFRNLAQAYISLPLGNSKLINSPIGLCSLGFIGPDVQNYHYSPGTWTGINISSWTSNIDSRKGESGSPVFSDLTGEVVALKRGSLNSGSSSVASLLTPLHLGSDLIEKYTGKSLLSLSTPPLAFTEFTITYETGINPKDPELGVTTQIELENTLVGRIDADIGLGEKWSFGARRKERINLTQPLLLARCNDLQIKVGITTAIHQWDVRFKVQGKLTNGVVLEVLPLTDVAKLGDNGNAVPTSAFLVCN